MVFLRRKQEAIRYVGRKKKGGGVEETAENRRIHEVADELRRRCQLYEAQSRGGKENVIAFETEQRVTEQYAKDNGLWLPLANIPSLGVPGPSGNENDLYVSDDVVFRDCRELSKVEAFRKYVVYATLNAPKRIVIQPPQ